jgi:hypothetical protein
MKRIGILVAVLVVAVALSGVAAAFTVPGGDKANDRAQSDNGRHMDGWELSPPSGVNPPGLESITFIHWKEGAAKPPCNNDGVCDPGENPSCSDCKNAGDDEDPEATCYAFMGTYGKKHFQWRSLPVSYAINPGSSGLSEAFVVSAVSAGAEEWDTYAGGELFSSPLVDYTAQYDVQNYVNAIVWGDLDTGIIGVTKVWFNPASKSIVEFDMKFNTDYAWGDGLVSSIVMDVQNIAAHEFGHSAGLADVYDTVSCVDVTMFGYSDYGETSKRDLEAPDIAGIQTLYP